MISPKKILVIRLSSFGDVLLTSFAIRSIKKSLPESEIHFLTKKQFFPLVEFNRNLEKKWIYPTEKNEIQHLLNSLKNEQFDLVLDWQNNFRSMAFRKLSKNLGVLQKHRISRFAYIHFKTSFQLNSVALRYLETAKSFGVQETDDGLELNIARPTIEKMEKIFDEWKGVSAAPVYFISAGAKHFTKRYPAEYFVKLINLIRQENNLAKFILIGGSDELETSLQIKKSFENNQHIWNAVGGFNVMESCALVRLCSAGFSNDSFLMHVASAFQIPVVAFFGSTTKNLGFTPFRSPHLIVEDNSVSCRPCSHIGKNECPKSHFNCMMNLEPEKIVGEIKQFLKLHS